MRSKIVSSIFFVATLLGPTAFAQEALQAASLPAAEAIPARGALYRIFHEGHSTYLFGTLHVGQAAFYPLEPRVTEALAKSSKLVLELDVRNNASFQSALQKHGMLGPDETIRDRLAPETYEQMVQALEKFGFPPQQVMRLKPWLAANILMGLNMELNGFQRKYGLEFHLIAAAIAQAKPVLELESAEYQLSLFDTMTKEEQEQYLRESIAGVADGSIIRKTRDLIAAWIVADRSVYDALLQESMNEKTTSSEFTHRVLLDKRNPEMADKIEDLLKNEPSTFVAVGLLHLLGETSVPALLRQKGYEVEKLY